MTRGSLYSKEEYITGETLYQYLHISKRKMRYLLENGYISYIDTGKKTHRYIIKKDDAEIFFIYLETDTTMGDTLKGHFGNQGKATNSKLRLVDDTEATSKAFKKYHKTQKHTLTFVKNADIT